MMQRNRVLEFFATGDRRIVALVLGTTLALAGALVGLSLAVIGPIYTLALLIALAGALWMVAGLRNALISIILIIALLPYAALPFKIVVTPTFLDIAMAAFFFLYVGEWMTGERRRLAVTPVHMLVVLFMVLSVFSFVAGLRYAGLTATVARQFAELLLSMAFSLVLVDVLKDSTQLRQVARIVMIAGALAATIGIVFWLMPDSLAESLLRQLAVIGYPDANIIQYTEQNPDLPERAIGTAANPNSLGGFLVMIAALVAPQTMTEHPVTGRRWHAFAMLGALVICLVLTLSRGSMLAFGAALLFIAALRYRRLLLVLAIVALLIFVLPWTQFWVLRLIEGFQGADLATQMRFGEYRDALKLIGRYPLLGVGFSGTPDVDIYLGVAMVYLTIASNMGLLGLGAFLLLMAAIFVYASQAMRRVQVTPELRPVLLGLVAGLVGALANGIFDHYFFNLGFHPAITILWTFVGMTLATARVVLATAEAGAQEGTARRLPVLGR